MSPRVFTSKALRQQLKQEELANLVGDFKSYKASGFPPETFGRDAPYDDERTWPLVRQEEVSHIHLADASTVWHRNILQYRRTSNKSHLVYCKGSMHNDVFLLIILLQPDAHKMHRDPRHMEKIGLMAQAFRNRF
ncbi:type II toxin-antitoxin system YafO family toxin [Rouxiella chamberiensis]|uniref:Type II toxin-antitoxin system YafO family toxin n=1 Tax=Rouxiella chamberiensis TaxID=1513468 RepID=A0ABY7HMV3_9GAMM|nr:type II toxin-antitoxin system YafO family toxin [Rouxiella chamberiensis]WAT00710.1 type II toxin-antitoxin system YafO family toxin [Rouxiella chamberiensis]